MSCCSNAHSSPAVGELMGFSPSPQPPLLVLTSLASSLYSLAAKLTAGVTLGQFRTDLYHAFISFTWWVRCSCNARRVLQPSTGRLRSYLFCMHAGGGRPSTYHQGSSVRGRRPTQTSGLLPQRPSSLRRSRVAETRSESSGRRGCGCYCRGSPAPHPWVSVGPDVQRNFLIITKDVR